MLIVLPFIVLFLLIWVWHLHEPGWRTTILSAAVTWGVLVTVMTEALSAVRLLNTAWIAGGWALATLALTVYSRTSVGQLKDCQHIKIVRASLAPALLLTGVGLIAAATGLIALVAPPNTWDAMAYHMPRVMHWIQFQSVEHYPTHTTQQLHRPPWAEFAILHLQLLSHGDRFANLVQWCSMVGSLIGVSLITKQLGGDAWAQVLAVVVTATIPMGILQASSTQTDYAGAFWLVCFVSFALPLLIRQQSPKPWRSTVLTGMSLGLAILTKATAYLYAAPFLLWIGLAGVKKLGWQYGSRLALIALIPLVLNSGHYLRNLDLFGSPICATGKELEPSCTVANEAWTFPLFFSNVVRNVAMHLGTPVEFANERLEQTVADVHALLGVEVTDARANWRQDPFVPLMYMFDENFDGNPLHLLILGFTVICMIAVKRIRRSPMLLAYSLALIAGFLLFNLVLKWNPYNSRWHLSLFVLWAPFVGMTLSLLQWPRVTGAIVSLVMVCSLPWVMFNEYRPLIVSPFKCGLVSVGNKGCRKIDSLHPWDKPTIMSADRYTLYFINKQTLAPYYVGAASFFLKHHCFHIGLIKGWNDLEYPLWVLMKEAEESPVWIEHVSVTNPTSVLSLREPHRSFRPCGILSITNTGSGQATLAAHLLFQN